MPVATFTKPVMVCSAGPLPTATNSEEGVVPKALLSFTVTLPEVVPKSTVIWVLSVL